MQKNKIFNLKNVELFTVSDFLSTKECDDLSNLILENNQRSTVAEGETVSGSINAGRTSNSAFLADNNPIVQLVNQKISDILGISKEYGEPLQGQLYEENQYYNDHHDYFDLETLERFHSSIGQRTWTAMIYLNHVEQGGHTEFPELGKSISPKKGTVVIWKNSDGKGFENPATLHSGRPVVKGRKIIATKWFREHPFISKEEKKPINENSKDILTDVDGNPVTIEYVNGIPHARYTSKDKIPRITSDGFRKMKIPENLYTEILDFYHKGLAKSRPEFDPNEDKHLNEFIKSKENYHPTEMIHLTDELKSRIFDNLQSTLESWSQRKIHRTYCYGIRTYKRGATLKKHIDGWDTRIISAILNVAQKVDEPWALQIDDHKGQEHEVYLQPGEMCLYESATLMHGRVKPFQGDYFSNLFVHYVNLS